MRSTRRSEGVAGLAGLGLLLAVGVGGAMFLPPLPEGPRYDGAGHETPQRGGTFVFHHESDVPGFDPLISYDEMSNMGIKLLFDGLLDYDRDTLELIPQLATGLPERHDDGRRYVIELRRGVRFHDSEIFDGGRGRELVADDVRWSLEHMLSPEVPSPGPQFFSSLVGLDEFRAGRASHVAGIRVLDRYRLELRLTQPDQAFLYALAMSFAFPVPREAYARWGDEVARHPVGTGPFVLESWDPGVAVTFVRNPTYRDPERPYVDRMVFELNLTRGPAVMRFRNGELDHVHRQSPADYFDLANLEGWAPYRVEGRKIDVWGVVMNCGMPPFDNRHLRRAVSFAIRPDRWIRARQNRLVHASQPIPSPLPGYDPDLPGAHHYDLERAREEMRLAGLPDGLDEPVEVWLGEGEVGRAYGELIQSDLAQIGIEVRLRQAAFPVFLAQTGRPRTAAMVFTGWNVDYPDASNFLDVLFHSRSIQPENSKNRAFYRNPEVDRLLDEARVEPDNERRLALFREASEIIVADAPWAFAIGNVQLEAWQPYVRNYRPHPAWSNLYRDVWLDLPRRPMTLAGRPSPTSLALSTLLTPLSQLLGPGSTP